MILAWVAAAAAAAASASGPAAPAGPAPLSALRARVLEAYGGAARLEQAVVVRQTGTTSSALHGGRTGRLVRTYGRSDRLRVEIAYPGQPPEVRILDGARGWRQGVEVSGTAPYHAMLLQAARLDVLSLVRSGTWSDEGAAVRDGRPVRLAGVSLGPGMALGLEVDEPSGRILRSTGRALGGPAGMLAFATAYGDFRVVDGLLFAFLEQNEASGVRTGETRLERVEVLDRFDPALLAPPAPAAPAPPPAQPPQGTKRQAGGGR